MEVFGMMGFMTGGAAMVFALMAIEKTTSLKKEVDELKETLNNAGVIDSSSSSDVTEKEID